MSEVINTCRLSTTPDKSCVMFTNSENGPFCKRIASYATSPFFKNHEVCPCPSKNQPVIRKSRMDELIDECLMDTNNSWRASVRKIFAPAVDAMERLEKAKKEGLAVIISDNGFRQVCTSEVIKSNLERGWKLVGYVVEDK